MTFQPLLARTPDEAPDALYPLPAEALNSFAPEDDDGTAIRSWDVEAVTATMGPRNDKHEVSRAERIKGVLTLTDSRLVFACTKFRTGGRLQGYGSGGIAVALAANAVSKAVATRETKGYSLVGHVRHEWLGGVTATKSRWGSSAANALSVLFADPTGENGVCRVDFHLPKRHVTAEAGEALVQRAIRRRIGLADETARGELETFLTAMPSSPTSDGNGRSWILP